jgi:hypothetical protein
MKGEAGQNIANSFAMSGEALVALPTGRNVLHGCKT